MPAQDLSPDDLAPTAVAENDLANQVQQTLAGYLRGRQDECEALAGPFGAAARELNRFVLGGGKRIRPTFAWWGWRAAGGDASGSRARATLRAVSALELIQACALLHDDLIDASATRRGHPTLHVHFAEAHRSGGWHGEPERFGMAAAILLGDLALSWADDMLHAAGVPQQALARALRPWRAMRTEVLAGQYQDIFSQVNGDESERSALRVAELKAASYTVERPLEFGAELGGADERAVDALRRFGADIGVAFQLRDDLLGVFGDPEVTGKPAGDDLREGKRTLLVAAAFERAGERGDTRALDVLRAAVGDPQLGTEAVERARAVLTELGAVQAVEQRIADLTDGALTALRSAELAEPAASRLAELAVEVTDRTH